ncbi:hypothetical protein CPB83DRAFT_858771 [Crepidotus variabilis]|uniref:Uncharacterized protein n=1 Tax=Crepidotus variabilis TaxID=179855 RepID=A0A9P6JMI3_9AGAR|nr:hypothetical protein CPB83DRAFT_858771 [Crepidotus variabilis]
MGARNVVFNGDINVHINHGLGGILLVDAAGREYPVSMEFAKSYEIFLKIVGPLLSGNAIEARIQRKFVAAGQFDLCIDHGPLVLPITGQRDWDIVESGVKIVLSVVLPQLRQDACYQCPRCDTWNTLFQELSTVSIDCAGCYGRFQISELDANCSIANELRFLSGLADNDLKMLRNFHLKRYVPSPTSLPDFPETPIISFVMDQSTNEAVVDSNSPSTHYSELNLGYSIDAPLTPHGIETVDEILAPDALAEFNEIATPCTPPLDGQFLGFSFRRFPHARSSLSSPSNSFSSFSSDKDSDNLIPELMLTDSTFDHFDNCAQAWVEDQDIIATSAILNWDNPFDENSFRPRPAYIRPTAKICDNISHKRRSNWMATKLKIKPLHNKKRVLKLRGLRKWRKENNGIRLWRFDHKTETGLSNLLP